MKKATATICGGDGGGDFGRKSEEEKGRTTRGVDWVDRLGRTGCFDPAGPHSVGAISSFDLGLIENTLNYIVSTCITYVNNSAK